MITASDSDLQIIAAKAYSQGNLMLGDQATSERVLRPVGDTSVVNHKVVKVIMQSYDFHCPLCNKRDRRAYGEDMIAAFRKRGYCNECWTGVQIGKHWYEPWFFPKSRIKYLEAALEQGFKAKALQFPADAPQRARLRTAYRKAEALLHDLRQRLKAAQADAPVVETVKDARS